MRKRTGRLIDEIEQEALDAAVPVSSPLRKLVALGGQAGSAELREWASLELRGYFGSDVPLPDYRKAGAVIRIDGATINSVITGQQISPSVLPDPVDKHIDESVPLNGPVAEIEAMIENAKRNEGGDIKLALPNSQDVVRLMNYEMQQRGGSHQQVTAVYWSVSHVSLEGVLDQVRTRLVELVAEMRVGMADEADVPSSAVADNAVSVVIHGNRSRVSIASAQASGDGSAKTSTVVPPDDAGWWRRIGAVVVGVAGVVGTLVAIAVWQNWNPF